MNVEAQPSVEHRGTHNVDIHVLFRQLILLMNLAHSKPGLRKIFSFLFFFHWFPQAPAVDAVVEKSTGLFDGSSQMFVISIASLFGLLGIAITTGLSYHFLIYIPRRNKGEKMGLLTN